MSEEKLFKTDKFIETHKQLEEVIIEARERQKDKFQSAKIGILYVEIFNDSISCKANIYPFTKTNKE